MNIVKNDAFTGSVFVTEWGFDVLARQRAERQRSRRQIVDLTCSPRTRRRSAGGIQLLDDLDLYEENDTGTNTAFRGGNFGLLLKGDPQIATSFDVAKPAFNAFRLLHHG